MGALAGLAAWSAAAAGYDVSADFATTTNPGAAWSYGWKEVLDGPFNLASYRKIFEAENGVPLMAWQAAQEVAPSIAYVVGPGTAVSAEGQFVAPPGTVWLNCGLEGSSKNFGIIRFTLPRGQNGIYRMETMAREIFSGPSQGDTDFHILHNGREIFGREVTPHGSARYTNELALVAGDTVEWAVGRGADGRAFGSRLKIEGVIRQVDPRPPGPDLLNILIDLIHAAPPSVLQEPLLASLNAVQASIVKGNTRAAVNQLGSFQSKVRAQVKPMDPTLASQYLDLARRIMEWLDPTGDFRVELAAMAGNPVVLETVMRVPGVGICVEALAIPGSNLLVERSKNMSDWSAAGVALETTDGRFQFLDHNPAGARYYRMRITED
jgi:hypothetical protein